MVNTYDNTDSSSLTDEDILNIILGASNSTALADQRKEEQTTGTTTIVTPTVTPNPNIPIYSGPEPVSMGGENRSTMGVSGAFLPNGKLSTGTGTNSIPSTPATSSSFRTKVSERIDPVTKRWIFTWAYPDGHTETEYGGYAEAPDTGRSGSSGTATGGSTNTPQSSQFGTSLQPGANTPFGQVIGNLPLGLGLEWHNLLLQQAKAMADQTGYQYTWDPTANGGQGGYVQGQKTLTAQLQESQIALANASKLFQEAALTGTYNGQPTLAAQQLKQQADQFAQSMGLSRDQLAEQIRQFNASLSFQQQQVAFNQANTLAQLAANPRTSIQASFLGSTRGGLGPDQANPMAGLSSFQQALTGTQPGVQQAQIMQGPDQAQPGSAAHYATEIRPDGSQVLYFGTPTRLADGSMANVPVGAFSRAIMEGRSVPSAGDIGISGGYTTTAQVRSNFNPNRIKLADYLRAAPSEQAQLQGVASYAGYSPEDFTSTLSKFAPKERSISGGARAY